MKSYVALLKTARSLRTERLQALASDPDHTPEDRELKLLNLLVRTSMQLVGLTELPKMGDANPCPIPTGMEWKNIDNAKPCPTGYAMADRNGPTYAQFVARGWTDELLIEHGFLQPLPQTLYGHHLGKPVTVPEGWYLVPSGVEFDGERPHIVLLASSDSQAFWSAAWPLGMPPNPERAQVNGEAIAYACNDIYWEPA